MRKPIRMMYILLLLSSLSFTTAHAADYSAGIHYFQLAAPQAVQTGDQIEVLELFWYGCPHCFKLEPVLEKWSKTKPKNSAHVRQPAILRDTWAFHARVYFTFEALNLVEKLHGEFFDELHKRKNRIRTEKQLIPFLEIQGVPKDKFLEAFNSFAVDSKVRNASLMSKRYELTGVPTIVVDGKYRATASSAGSHEQLMELVNSLVAKAAKERN